MKSTIQFQLSRIKANLAVFLILVVIGILVVYTGYLHQSVKQAIAYLTVMVFSAFLIDFSTHNKPSGTEFSVRNPRKESGYFLLTVVLGSVFLYFRFLAPVDWNHQNLWIKLAVLPCILFVFPVGLAIIMLLLKYKPADMGIRLQGLWIAVPIIFLSAITNHFVSPKSLTWNAMMAEGGSIAGTLFTGLIVAGLSEEFFRVVGQTRIGALCKNYGMGWIITTVIWAFMHAPKWYMEEKDIQDAVLGSIRIIPIGLMWGYLTHRTKSILPSVLVHGTNFWGLQNF